MITQTGIAHLCQLIAEQFAPERIILFGSRAGGRPGKDSDVDLLVVKRYKGKSVRKAAEILNTVEPDFPVDLIVRSPEEVETRLAMKDPFFTEILQRGKVLYEAAHA